MIHGTLPKRERASLKRKRMLYGPDMHLPERISSEIKI